MCSWIRNIENKSSVMQERTNSRIARQRTNEWPLFLRLFIICDIPNGRGATFLLHCIFYPFICGFTWCSYCLICRFLSNVLLTTVFRFILFILAIALSGCLRLTVIGDTFGIFSSFSYPWVRVMCRVFLIILGGSSWQKTRLQSIYTNDWLIDCLIGVTRLL
jgi:hypothetical protein